MDTWKEVEERFVVDSLKELSDIEKSIDMGLMENLDRGVYCQNQDSIIQDQVSWCDDDPCKYEDFTQYKYYVTTDDGQEPQGFDTFDEIIEEFAL